MENTLQLIDQQSQELLHTLQQARGPETGREEEMPDKEEDDEEGEDGEEEDEEDGENGDDDN